MPKILILYWSAYGHVEQMAKAVAEGARAVAGAEVTVKRVPELTAEDEAKRDMRGLDQRRAGRDGRGACRLRRDRVRHADPVRQHGRADARLSRPHRRAFGPRMPWSARSAACSPAARPSMAARNRRSCRRRSPCCITAWWSWACPIPARRRRRSPRSPAARRTAPARSPGGDGSRQPSENELGMARFQGEHVARIAAKLAA